MIQADDINLLINKYDGMYVFFFICISKKEYEIWYETSN